MADRDFIKQLTGYSLTTAEILYRLPDHPSLLQTFLWQEYDIHPKFPRLHQFLDFWTAQLEGSLYKVRVAHAALLRPAEIELRAHEMRLN